MILSRTLWVLVWLVGIVHSVPFSNSSITAITSTLKDPACPTLDPVILSCDGCGAIQTCYVCFAYNDYKKRQESTCLPVFQTTTVISVSTTTDYTTKQYVRNMHILKRVTYVLQCFHHSGYLHDSMAQSLRTQAKADWRVGHRGFQLHKHNRYLYNCMKAFLEGEG